ncbi:MAG: 50S ribosomal protein L10 [Bacteroidales bacterium]|nr:50S ribosomal protein L10 [Bacteroidales bacterium]HOY38181.1 50S ribosomal protein L10 [Bacteroidales bacterium]HQP04078.1 50S ribosomal protein L10 [Bacteroidales bacterium]
MKREEKDVLIEQLKEQIGMYSHFYLTDAAELNAQEVSDLRRKCFESDIKMVVVKNTLFKLALERAGKHYEELYPALQNNTAVLFCNTASTPGKLIKEFRKNHEKPVFKAAYAEEMVFIGEDQLDALATIKTKDELIGDLIFLLQSPMKQLLSQLNSGKHIVAGVVKTLAERE